MPALCHQPPKCGPHTSRTGSGRGPPTGPGSSGCRTALPTYPAQPSRSCGVTRGTGRAPQGRGSGATARGVLEEGSQPLSVCHVVPGDVHERSRARIRTESTVGGAGTGCSSGTPGNRGRGGPPAWPRPASLRPASPPPLAWRFSCPRVLAGGSGAKRDRDAVFPLGESPTG